MPKIILILSSVGIGAILAGGSIEPALAWLGQGISTAASTAIDQ